MLLGQRQLSDASLKYFIRLFLRREFECEFEFHFFLSCPFQHNILAILTL